MLSISSMRLRCLYFAAFLLSFLASPPKLHAAVVYDNLSTILPFYFGLNTFPGYGENVSLGGTDRTINSITFAHYGAVNYSGTYFLTLYQGSPGNGPSPAVATPLGPSLALNIGLGTGTTLITVPVNNYYLPGNDLLYTLERSPATGNSGPRLYDPPAQGSSTNQFWLDTGGGNWISASFGGNPAANFGFRVQAADPVLSATVADGGTLDIGPVRVGTSDSASLGINNNLGTAGSTLIGSISGASGEFAPAGSQNFSLGSGGSANFNYTYTPTARGSDNVNLSLTSNGVEGDGNGIDNETYVLAGQGVGPVFGYSFTDALGPSSGSPLPSGTDNGGAVVNVGATIDFGEVDLISGPTTVAVPLTLSNNTTDGDLGDLTDLTITDYAISGAAAGLFTVYDINGVFDPVANGPETIAAGDTLDLMVEFSADFLAGISLQQASLLFMTNQGVALQANGADFEFALAATQTPEPAGLIVWTLVMAAALPVIRRLRKRS